jgi:hypothetical protein
MTALKLKADIMWANLDRPNDMSGKYQVDLCNLSQAAVQALSSLGITPKQKEDKGFFITCKSTQPIRAYDMDGDVLDQRVGNGSKAIAMIGTYSWTFKNKEGVSPSLKKLVIENLVGIDNGESIEEFDEDEVL